MSTRTLTVRRGGALSFRLDLRVAATLAVLGVVTAFGFVLSIALGEFPISLPDVVATLVGGGDDATRFVVVDLRLPRALTAVLAGIALGIAGTIFQEIARNPLVAPDIIGITTGASLAAVSLAVLGETSGALSISGAALAGGLVTGIALYVLAWRGGVQGYRLVLVGIGVAALLQAGVSYVLTRGQIYEVAQAYVWLVGSLNGRSWDHVWPLAATLAVLLPLALALGRQIEALQLGDDLARALGAHVERTRLLLLAIAIVLTAIAVSACGPIAFVAFIAPHLARRIGATSAPSSVLPLAGATGAILVVAADLAGRELFGSTEVPVGIITSIIAAPYFLWLLRRAGRLGVTG